MRGLRLLVAFPIFLYFLPTVFEMIGFRAGNFFLGCRNVFLFLGLPSFASMASSDSTKHEGDLTFFFHHHSYYSRKVWLALEEKKISYRPRLINIMSQEQYEPWFMAINPRGEIPVLEDGSKVIIDSKRIINYLEDNFGPPDYVSLVPTDVDDGVRELVAELRGQIDAIEGNMIAFGLVNHREYVRDSDEHYPYNIPGIKGSLKNSIITMAASLRNISEKYPQYKDILLEKAANAEKTSILVQNKESYSKEVAVLEQLLSALEEQLARHPTGGDDWWLCCERYTLADVSLTILMDRLWRMGAAEYFWGRRPHLTRYFQRVQQREAYKRIEPTLWSDFSFVWPYAVGLLLVVTLIIVALCMIPVIKRRLRSQ